MRKIFLSILSFFVAITLASNIIYASGVSISGSTVVNLYEGSTQSITITASNAAGRIDVVSNDSKVASVNASSQFLDNSSMTFTIRAVKAGSTTIVISGTYATYDGPQDQYVYRVITVNVYEKTSTTPVTPSPGVTTPSLSSVKLLGSLSIENLKFEEEFASGRTEYTVYAPYGTETVNIKATAASAKASISSINGAVKEGWNDIEFTCTAEDGSKQTYKIKVYVEEKPEIYFNEGTLGVVKNLDKVTIPEGFEKETITIEEKEVDIFTNKGISIIYLADSEMTNKEFYIYEKETNSILSIYQPVELSGKKYIILDFNYEDFLDLNENYERSVTFINDVKYNTWTSKADNMSDFRILYLMNEDGEKQLYTYDKKEETMQRFILPVYPVIEETPTFWQQYRDYILLGTGAAGLLMMVTALIVSVKTNKKLKNRI